MLKLSQSMAVVALLFGATEVDAGKMKHKEEMPIIILGDPSRSMMGLEQPWSNARQQFFQSRFPEPEMPQVVPVVMAIKGDDDDGFEPFARGPQPMHVMRPDVFMVAEPRGNPQPEQPHMFEPPVHHDFFSDTFGQDMARNMESMEREMQSQMRSMDEMHRQMEERFRKDFGKPMPSLQRKDAEASKGAAAPGGKKANLTSIGANKTAPAAAAAPAVKDFATSEFSNSETTTEYDTKAGVYRVEKCVNGKCEKFTQFKNGTMVAQSNQTDQVPEKAKAASVSVKVANATVASKKNATVAAKKNATVSSRKPAALSQHNQTAEGKVNATVNQTVNQSAAANLTAMPGAVNRTLNATAVAAPAANATLSENKAHSESADDKKEGDKKEDKDKKDKEEDEKAKKEIEEKLKELQKYKDAEEAAKKEEEKRAKLKKKQEEIKKASEDALHDSKMKTAEEKKAFWKAKAAAIKNATEMEKEEKEQDEKDYKEMKKITPAVTAKTITKVQEDVKAKEAARDARIKAYNNKVLHATPKSRAPEPEIKDADKDPAKAQSDAAVEEMKALRKNGTEEVDPKQQLTAQLPAKQAATKQLSFTDGFGQEHVHFAQQANSTAAPGEATSHSTQGSITLKQSEEKKAAAPSFLQLFEHVFV